MKTKTLFVWKDMKGNELRLGHIVAVRYVWNSCVGIIRFGGLSLHEGAARHAGFASYHKLETTATYQILSHVNPDDKDYNAKVNKWFKSEKGDCPIKINVYDDIIT